MNFRTTFTVMIFILFVSLCGIELLGNIAGSGRMDAESPRYVRSVDGGEGGPRTAPPAPLNLKEIMRATDLDG